MKKIGVLLIIVLLLTGCGKKTARDRVEMFFLQYKTLSASVINDLEANLEQESWSDEEKDKYRMIIKRQYKDLEYKILNERYDNNKVYIDTLITVYDLYKAQNEPDYYTTDTDLSYLDYRLNSMANATDRVEYNITFTVEKDENGDYKIIDLDKSDIEKIHGIYNYEE